MSRKTYDDRRMQELLALGDRLPGPPPGFWESLAGKERPEARRRRILPVILWSSPLAAAAAAVLVFLFFPGPELPYQWTAGAACPKNGVSWNGELPVLEEKLTLWTASEVLVLQPGTKLRVASEPLWNRGSRKANLYHLDAGSLSLDHHDPATSFVLRTPFGDVSPLGTQLTVEVTPQRMVLRCHQGRLVFSPEEGGQVILDPGEELLWPPQPGEDQAISNGGTRESPSAAREVPVPGPQAAPDIPAPIPEPSPEPQKTSSREPTLLRVLGAVDQALWTTDGYHLFLHSQGELRAVDPQGTVVWQVSTPPVAFGGPALAAKVLYLPGADGTLGVYNPETGQKIREYVLGAGSYGVPLRVGNRVFLSTVDKKFLALDVETGAVVWSGSTPERLVGDRPWAEGQGVYVQTRSGQVLGWDRQTGESLPPVKPPVRPHRTGDLVTPRFVEPGIWAHLSAQGVEILFWESL